MRTRIPTIVAALFVALSFIIVAVPSPVRAITLEFNPANQTVIQGNTPLVDVVVHNPGTLIGAYDLFVNYDPAILSWSGVTPGPALGSGTGNSSFSVDETTLGALNVFEVSFLSDFTGLQDGTSDVTLFSILFDTLAPGTSPLSFTGSLTPGGGFLGDANGNLIPVDQVGSGSITVNAVPEPGTLLLVGIGLAGLALCRRRKVS